MISPKNIYLNGHHRLLAIVLFVTSSMMTACFGPKNLVTKLKDETQYDFVGDTLHGWALVRQDSLWGYVSQERSREISPMFLWATDFTDGVALARDERGYRYINSQGKLLRRIKVSRAYSFAEGLAPVQIKGKWGYIDRKGKIVIKPQFDWAEPFQENRAAVSIGQRKGYINPVGQLIIPVVYQETNAFKNGVAVVRKDFQFGIIDTLGNFVLPNHFAEIKPWEIGCYRLGVFTPNTNRVNRFGLADADGKLLIDTQYAAIELHARDYIRVKQDSLYGLFDRWGKETVPMEDQPPINVYEGRIWVHSDSSSILLDEQSREIKRFYQYNRVYPFSNGYAAVSVKDTNRYNISLYGYIDRDGNEVVAPQYDGGTGYVNPHGISIVGQKSYGIVRQYLFNIHEKRLVDEVPYSNLQSFGPLLFNSYGDFLSSKTGRPIEKFPYQSIHPLKGDRPDLAAVRSERKVGLIDTSLTELMPLEYADINASYEGRMKVKQNDHWGFADEQYRIRIPMIYDAASYFRYPTMTEVTQNKKKGLIDRYGKEIIPLHYTHIYLDPSIDRIYAEKEDGIDIYDQEGRLLHMTDFGYIGFYGRNKHVVFRQNGKTGFMDYDFTILHEPEFDGAGPFYDGLAWVALNGRGGYMNKEFKLVIPIQFEDIENFALGLAKVKKGGREYFINTAGDEVTPTEAVLAERDEEMKRRMAGWVDFSS